jgi:transposase, IS30 family
MAKKPKLKLVDRFNIKILLDSGHSLRAIARSMERGHNTISYEVKRNGGMFGYNPNNADIYARTRKKDAKVQWKKIEKNKDLKTFIISKLESHWNPDEISGYMKRKKMKVYISKNSIYRWLYSPRGQQYCHFLYSKRYHRKKRVKKTERVMIPERVSIDKRFLGADNRTRYGHWEYDTVVSRKGCAGGLSVGSERKGKLVVATVVRSMSTHEHMEAVEHQTSLYKTLSITFDNGIENKQHATLGIPTFFCEPYSSWQKGGVENANKMLRYFFPRGTNFRTVSQKKVNEAVSFINNKPRKSLGYKTALEVSRACGMIKKLSVSVLIEAGI